MSLASIAQKAPPPPIRFRYRDRPLEIRALRDEQASRWIIDVVEGDVVLNEQIWDVPFGSVEDAKRQGRDLLRDVQAEMLTHVCKGAVLPDV